MLRGVGFVVPDIVESFDVVFAQSLRKHQEFSSKRLMMRCQDFRDTLPSYSPARETPIDYWFILECGRGYWARRKLMRLRRPREYDDRTVYETYKGYCVTQAEIELEEDGWIAFDIETQEFEPVCAHCGGVVELSGSEDDNGDSSDTLPDLNAEPVDRFIGSSVGSSE